MTYLLYEFFSSILSYMFQFCSIYFIQFYFTFCYLIPFNILLACCSWCVYKYSIKFCVILNFSSLFKSILSSKNRLTSGGSQCKCWGNSLPAGSPLPDPQWPLCKRSLETETDHRHRERTWVCQYNDYFPFPSRHFLLHRLKGSHCYLQACLSKK